MKKFYIISICLLIGLQSFCPSVLSAQTNEIKENLGRGLVAYRKIVDGKTKICISWRYLSKDDPSIKFNVYRVVPTEEKLNEEPLTTTWFEYEDERPNRVLRFYLKEVVDGVESETVAQYLLKSGLGMTYPYIEIPMKQIDGDDSWAYSPNDAVVADLDGDGEFEIIVHRTGAGKDNAQSGVTDPPVLQAYKLTGKFLWEINLGVNIREGAHYTQFMVYDLDGDGKAEVVCKTAEGTIDSKGTAVGEAYFPEYKKKYNLSNNFNVNANYRNSGGYILQGPEFLTVFNGETGEEVVTTEYDPPRYSTYNSGNEIPKMTQTGDELKSRWGDNYGNRVDRFLACVAYLGGENHSVVMCRGYYTRSVLVAYDYINKKLVKRWKFDTWNNSSLSSYTGQGNHNLRVADVNGDGFDEIIYGQMAVSHNGKGLYTTKLGHGDAMHIGDFVPERPGLEVLGVHENKKDGTTLRDAKTGEVIYQITSGDDVGRGMGADIDPNHRGMEFWSSRSGGVISGATGEVIRSSASGVSMNMACWWDGDLLRELQDGISVTKYNYTAGGSTKLMEATGCESNNSTKSNPCLQADVLGDWREEVILRTSDNKAVRIYLTPYETDYRFHTFMEDPVYRMSVVYQNVAYNQPTNTGFYFGPDLENIFVEKNIRVEQATYTLDPVFDAISYKWSTGETTKKAVLKYSDFTPEVATPVYLDMNFRGYNFSDTVYVTFAQGSAIEDVITRGDVELKQTVVQDELTINLNTQGVSQLKIFNTAGIMCVDDKIAGGIASYPVNVSALPQGMYILTVVNNSKTYTFRFVKTN